jgi:hypothetical protein
MSVSAIQVHKNPGSICKQLAIGIAKQYGSILLNGFETNISEADKHHPSYVPITLAHFRPISTWGQSHTRRKMIEDLSTQDLYLPDEPNNIRRKCAAAFVGTLILQPIGLSCNCINRMAKIGTLAHLWHPTASENYNLKGRLLELKSDVLRVALTPLILGGLAASALYGIARPYDGRKLHATLERATYGITYKRFPLVPGKEGAESPDKFMNFLTAACFQPKAVLHTFGGNILEENSW